VNNVIFELVRAWILVEKIKPSHPIVPDETTKRRGGVFFLPIYNAYGFDYKLQTIFILLIQMILPLNLMTLGVKHGYSLSNWQQLPL